DSEGVLYYLTRHGQLGAIGVEVNLGYETRGLYRVQEGADQRDPRPVCDRDDDAERTSKVRDEDEQEPEEYGYAAGGHFPLAHGRDDDRHGQHYDVETKREPDYEREPGEDGGLHIERDEGRDGVA